MTTVYHTMYVIGVYHEYKCS